MNPLVLSSLISGGAGLLGSLFSAKSQAQTNQQNIDQAQQQEQFQERMSSTAHQREVEDLEAAGLNPILSANSGASTPGGAMATLKNPAENIPGQIANTASQIADNALKNAQTINLAANSAKTAAETTEPQLKSDIIKSIRNFFSEWSAKANSRTVPSATLPELRFA